MLCYLLGLTGEVGLDYLVQTLYRIFDFLYYSITFVIYRSYHFAKGGTWRSGTPVIPLAQFTRNSSSLVTSQTSYARVSSPHAPHSVILQTHAMQWVASTSDATQTHWWSFGIIGLWRTRRSICGTGTYMFMWTHLLSRVPVCK